MTSIPGPTNEPVDFARERAIWEKEGYTVHEVHAGYILALIHAALAERAARDAAEADAGRLRAALKPWADAGKTVPPEWDDEAVYRVASDGNGYRFEISYTVGDLRRAALAGTEGETNSPATNPNRRP